MAGEAGGSGDSRDMSGGLGAHAAKRLKPQKIERIQEADLTAQNIDGESSALNRGETRD